MNSKDFVEAKEVIIKTDRIQGNMVILKEFEQDSQYFLMFVGDAEITAIAKEKGLVDPKRPLTHDLYLAVLSKAGVTFDRIEIYGMQDNTYYAKVFTTVNDEVVEFDMLNILTETGLQQMRLTEVQGIRLTNEKIDAELRKALATLATSRPPAS